MVKIPTIGNVPTNAADIQALIDEQIAANGLDKYVDFVTYVAQGSTAPEGATHVLSLKSLRNGADLVVAIKAKGFLYPRLLDALLSVI